METQTFEEPAALAAKFASKGKCGQNLTPLHCDYCDTDQHVGINVISSMDTRRVIVCIKAIKEVGLTANNAVLQPIMCRFNPQYLQPLLLHPPSRSSSFCNDGDTNPIPLAQTDLDIETIPPVSTSLDTSPDHFITNSSLPLDLYHIDLNPDSPLPTPQVPMRQSTRHIHKLAHLNDYVCSAIAMPSSSDASSSSTDAVKDTRWEKAMASEIQDLEANNTWTFTSQPLADPQEEYSPLSVEEYSPQSVEDYSLLLNGMSIEENNIEEYSLERLEDDESHQSPRIEVDESEIEWEHNFQRLKTEFIEKLESHKMDRSTSFYEKLLRFGDLIVSEWHWDDEADVLTTFNETLEVILDYEDHRVSNNLRKHVALSLGSNLKTQRRYDSTAGRYVIAALRRFRVDENYYLFKDVLSLLVGIKGLRPCSWFWLLGFTFVVVHCYDYDDIKRLRAAANVSHGRIVGSRFGKSPLAGRYHTSKSGIRLAIDGFDFLDDHKIE
ncbi:hypothetical protein LWI28_026483 [Acer negundo]|uniref:Uncharacterized protein n=1 Tax=Acer negundo TaxID=4023 RepID=A0AAD5JER4_ACENE|nr:hypothetical protein LWI28_026483 [Acer negundo]